MEKGEKMEEKEKNNITIEDGFTQLNELLRLMENEDTGLEDSFDLSQKGVELVKMLNEKLDNVEGKLTEADSDNE